MIRSRRCGLFAAVAAAIMLLTTGLSAAPVGAPAIDAQSAELGTLRAQAITAAHAVQQKEQAVAALDLAVGVVERGADAKQQQLDQSDKDEAQLLGALARLARAPPEALALAPEEAVNRARSGILLAAAVPALEAQAKTLAAQLASLTAARTQIEARRAALDDADQALAKARETLASLVAQRNDLTAKLLHTDPKADPKAGTAKLDASDLFDLIKRADEDADRRQKDLLQRLRNATPVNKGAPLADPTRPSGLRALNTGTMLWPVTGNLSHRFGEADLSGRPSQGLALSAPAAAVVVAPFDGQVVYAGKFRDYGLILIIRHGGGYHSLLVGLGQVDVTSGQWLLAGEPVGVMPGADDKNAGVNFYLELRRDGRPVDPQSRLVSREEKTGESKVGE